MYFQSRDKTLGNRIVNLLYDLWGGYSVELFVVSWEKALINHLGKKNILGNEQEKFKLPVWITEVANTLLFCFSTGKNNLMQKPCTAWKFKELIKSKHKHATNTNVFREVSYFIYICSGTTCMTKKRFWSTSVTFHYFIWNVSSLCLLQFCSMVKFNIIQYKMAYKISRLTNTEK